MKPLLNTIGATAARVSFGALLAGALFGAVFHLTQAWAIGIKLLCISAVCVVLIRKGSLLQALCAGWAWGAGATLTGMAWLYVAMHDVGGMPAWMAGAAMVLFSALLGVFNGLALLAGAWVTAASRIEPQLTRVFGTLGFAACWVLGEWLRTWVLTGLPWMSVGYGFLDTPLVGLASSLGVIGVSAAAVLLAANMAQLLNAQRWRAIAGASAVLLVCYAAGQRVYTQPHAQPFSVALLQGNVPQNLKFDPLASHGYMRQYAQMAAQSKAAVTVMPETALPALNTQIPPDVWATLSAAPGLQVIGLAGELGGRYTNRMATPFAKGTASQWVYDKHHLVPFGEAIPWGFQWFVDTMNMPLSSMGRGAAAQAPLQVGDVTIAPNICYEEIFAHEWRASGAAAHALLNVSNFGWYGNSTVFAQHAAIARMRALEFQKPYLSATNNGATLAVLPSGAVHAQLPPNTQATLSVSVQGMAGQTPYARWGDWGVVVLALLALLLTGWRMFKARQT